MIFPYDQSLYNFYLNPARKNWTAWNFQNFEDLKNYFFFQKKGLVSLGLSDVVY